jgi:hypothetical protein
MTVETSAAKIINTLGTSDPKVGITGPGTSNNGSREDHIHPMIIPVGVWVNGGIPYMEATSTLSYVFVPGNFLQWDTVLEMFYGN